MRRYILIIKTNIYISKNTNLTTLKMLNLFPNNIPILYYLLIQFKRTSPRKRGKNMRFGFVKRRRGSPPLTRGKQRRHYFRGASHRITPAHAGKTAILILLPLCNKDHPRSRGENQIRVVRLRHFPGSPPLTRGKRSLKIFRQVKYRITPAHAGKTEKTKLISGAVKDHPRSRGENLNPGILPPSQWGSPPLTRGKPDFGCPPCLHVRITPAHAGKTPSCRIL